MACGPGAIAFEAARQLTRSGSVVGADLSERMVELAPARAATDGRGHVTFQRMAAEDHGLEGEGFDDALCSLGLMYAPDPVEALSRMHDALRPGGRAVAVVWGAKA